MACCFNRNHVYSLLQTQVIAFLYTAMRGIDLGLSTTPIVTPVNVLHNWRHEFKKWRPGELKRLHIFMLEDVPRFEEQEAPGSRSFFTEIIASILDIKFSKDSPL